MNTEGKETLQSLLREVMLLVSNNPGVMNLQKIIPQLADLQIRINKIGSPHDIINYMSI